MADLRSYALVVNDNPFIPMEACAILEEFGFRTWEASNGDLAATLLSFDHENITLLFTDVQMPGSMNGFALARHVAELYPNISIVAASGQLKPAEGDLPDGATCIGKPFSAEVTRARLEEILPDGAKPEPLKSRSA